MNSTITEKKITPEEENKLVITSWLNENQIKVYWEKKNQYNYPIFKTKGTQKKPDLLFYSPKLQEWIAAEAKQPHGKQIRQSQKIISYLKDAEQQKTTYHINNTEIKPTIFITLTKNSLQGHLFNNEQIYKKRTEQEAQTWGCPQTEYTRTHDFYRTLISNWKDPNTKYSLGILLSYQNKPRVMFKRYNKRINKWWGHRFWQI